LCFLYRKNFLQPAVLFHSTLQHLLQLMLQKVRNADAASRSNAVKAGIIIILLYTHSLFFSMRKFILFIVVSFLFLDVPAQSSPLKQLQEELKSHPQQDTILVNRLNKMAGRRELSTPGRDSASADALIISPQLRYIAGEVRALLRQPQTKDKALKFDLMKQAVAVGEKAGQAVVRRNLQILMLWQMNIYDSAIMV
jgi:hypothetical protein